MLTLGNKTVDRKNDDFHSVLGAWVLVYFKMLNIADTFPDSDTIRFQNTSMKLSH